MIYVVSVKPVKNSRYEVTLSNDEKLLLSEDVVVFYRLVKDNKLNDFDLEAIKNKERFYEGYQKSIKYLQAYAKSSYQIKNYLKRNNYSDELILEIVNTLLENGILDDKSFTSDYVSTLVNQGFGKKMIYYKIKTLGVIDTYIKEALELIDEDYYFQCGYNLALKQSLSYKKYDESKKDLKLKKYLENRGYEYDVIFKITKRMALDD